MSNGRTGAAVIIGGTGGIGAACGQVLAAMGYQTVLVARTAERLAATARGIDGARFVAGNAANAADVQLVFDTVGPVEVLVHAAGQRIGQPVGEQAIDILDELYASHLRSVFLCIRAALPSMSAGSRVILISSVAARRAVPGLAGYCAMKAGLGMVAQSLSMELDAAGIGVYIVAPAQVETPLLVKRWHCLQPADVASAVGYLASVDATLKVREFDLRAVTRGPHAPPLSGPPDGVVGVALVGR